MNDFECRYNQALHDAATQLAEEETPYHLARLLIKANERIERLENAADQRLNATLANEHFKGVGGHDI